MWRTARCLSLRLHPEKQVANTKVSNKTFIRIRRHAHNKAERCVMRTELLVDAQAHFITDGFYFRGIHSKALGGKGMETAGSFGAELVAKDVLALLKQPDEENHLFVPQFEISTEAARPATAAAQFHRLAAGGLHVFKREIIVGVLRREL